MASGLSRSALKASTSRTTSAEFLLSCESSVNTPATSRLDGLIQAHHWRVDSDQWAQVALDLYKPLEPNVIVNASDQNVAICSTGTCAAIRSCSAYSATAHAPT